MRIIGLDCSSSVIGYCIIDFINNKPHLKYHGFIKSPKTSNIFDKLIFIKQEITKLMDLYKPDIVALEEIAKFMPGISSANTIITLGVVNRTVGLTIYEKSGKLPELLNVMSIRHGLKFSKELPKKEDMPELVAKHLKIKFPYEFKKNGDIKKENYDVADSIAVGLFCGIQSKQYKFNKK